MTGLENSSDFPRSLLLRAAVREVLFQLFDSHLLGLQYISTVRIQPELQWRAHSSISPIQSESRHKKRFVSGTRYHNDSSIVDLIVRDSFRVVKPTTVVFNEGCPSEAVYEFFITHFCCQRPFLESRRTTIFPRFRAHLMRAGTTRASASCRSLCCGGDLSLESYDIFLPVNELSTTSGTKCYSSND